MRTLLLTLIAGACTGTSDDRPTDRDAGETDLETDVDETDDDTAAPIPHTDPPEGPPTYRLRAVTSPDGLVHASILGGSGSGAFVGYAADEAWSPTSRPVRIDVGASTATVLSAPEDVQGLAYGARGTTVVGKVGRDPVIWVDGTRSPLAVPEGYGSGAARGVAGDGTIVGSYADDDDVFPTPGPRPCAWEDAEATARPLATLSEGREVGAAWAVSDDGIIAGAVDTPAGPRAVVWSRHDAAPTPVGTPEEAVLSEALGVDAHGHVVGRVTYADFTSAAFTTADGTFVELDDLGEGYAEALDLDDRHVIVGIARAPGPVTHAMLWWDGAPYDLNDLVDELPEGITHLARAAAVDGEGNIAVEAVTDGGGQVILVAEPMVP